MVISINIGVARIARRIVEFINYSVRVLSSGGTLLTGADGTTRYMSDQIKTLKSLP